MKLSLLYEDETSASAHFSQGIRAMNRLVNKKPDATNTSGKPMVLKKSKNSWKSDPPEERLDGESLSNKISHATQHGKGKSEVDTSKSKHESDRSGIEELPDKSDIATVSKVTPKKRRREFITGLKGKQDFTAY